jgi:hypothetical protein
MIGQPRKALLVSGTLNATFAIYHAAASDSSDGAPPRRHDAGIMRKGSTMTQIFCGEIIT